MAITFLLVLVLTAVVLIVLILIQRGKGGGLAGAFGGLGGQSAFGTKAGDTFTKITIGVAGFWILLCIVGVAFIGVSTTKRMKLPGGQGVAPAATSGSSQTPQGTSSTSPGTSSSAPAGGASAPSSGGAPQGAGSGAGASRPAGSGSTGGGS